MLDGTVCPIQTPDSYPNCDTTFSGKHHHHALKYEIGVNPENGHLAWIGGPTVGSMHDMRLMYLTGVVNILQPGELILADKGYIGHSRIVTPFRLPCTEEEKDINFLLSGERWIVEHVLSRFKLFNCLSNDWRHDLDLHKLVFYVIGEIVNIDMYFAPVRK